MGRVETIGSDMLYLGDCREIPPYGIQYESGHTITAPWKAGKKIINDDDCAMRDEARCRLPSILMQHGRYVQEWCVGLKE